MRKSVAGTAADPTVPFTELEIDEKKYSLVYDFNAIAESEKLSGCNLLQGVAGFLMNTASAAEYRGLLFAALRKGHPAMSIEQAGALVRIDTMADIRMAMFKAYSASMPEKKRMSAEVEENPSEQP